MFEDEQRIFNNSFSEPFMRNFVQSNSIRAGNIFMNGLDNPDRNASSHFGRNVLDSDTYDEDLRHGGQHNWARFVLRPERWTIGLSKKGSVVFYSDVDIETQIQFIVQRILV